MDPGLGPTRRVEIASGAVLRGWLQPAARSVWVLSRNLQSRVPPASRGAVVDPSPKSPAPPPEGVRPPGPADHPYTGLGKLMVEEGLLDADGLSLAAIRREFRRNPKQVVDLINRNDSYVFFTQYDGGTWPAGSLGVAVTTQRTLATDKRIYPRGGLVLVKTKAVTYGGGQREFLQFMLDQDTGGAIQAPGRADIFMGIGSSAEILAGGQYAEGRLYYFFLKTR